MNESPRFAVIEATLGSVPAPLTMTAPPAALIVRGPENRLGAVRFRKPAPPLVTLKLGANSPSPPLSVKPTGANTVTVLLALRSTAPARVNSLPPERFKF